jgi:LPXTG-motif cell wall-anchored protein
MNRSARRGVRGFAVVGLSAALALSGATLASADVDPSPSPSASADGEGYEPEPALTVEVLEPICDGDVPYLQYAVNAENLDEPADDVTLTWVGSGGESFVQSGLPLSGRVLWPGAEVDEAGNALDWPGWRLEGDEWVVGDEWDWVRPEVGLEFEVNPTVTASVGYPESSPACATPPGEPEPTIEVDVLTPLCIAGVSYLDYAVRVTGTPSDTVTLTWANPDGDDVVMAGQPLAGRVLWPGAYPERFVDLSADDGWELVNNMWQNTRDFGWAVGTVDVTFGVNPEVTVPVTYPDDTENCLDEEAPPPPGSPDEPGNPTVANPPGPNLPVTGGQVAGIIAVAGALLLAGILAVVVTRRRRTE